MAGSALPDWVRACGARVREDRLPKDSNHLEELELTRGVRSHLATDHRFHTDPFFQELCQRHSETIRRDYSDRSVRVSFMVHVTLELLLDARLCTDDDNLLDAYYDQLHHLDLSAITDLAEQYSAQPLPQLRGLIERFTSLRFLGDYQEDDRLLERLQQILRRVRLSPDTTIFARHLGSLRASIDQHWQRLVTTGHPNFDLH